MSRNGYRATRGTVVFRIIFFVLLAAAVTAVAVILSWLWRFLESYEISRDYRVADAIAAELERGSYEKLFAGTEIEVSPYETEEIYRRAVTEKLGGKITCSKSAKESKENSPVYLLKSDGEHFAYLRLAPSGTKTEFGFDMYAFASIYGLDVPRNEYVTIKAPNTCKAYVNGKLLDGTAISDTEPLAEAEYFGTFLGGENAVTAVNTYFVSGLINPPTVAVSGGGKAKPLAYDNEKKEYICENEVENADVAASAQEYARDFVILYSKYIANDVSFATLSPYLFDGTKLYEDMFGYEGKYYTWHSSYEFSDEETVFIRQYSDTCFAVRVRCLHSVYYGGEAYPYNIDNTVYAVKTDDGWKTAALVMN